jgi:hypothetical protein
MKRKSVVAALALIVSVVASTSAFVPSAGAGILTVDITGTAPGRFDHGPLTDLSFDIHLVGTTGGGPLIDPLTIAQITLGALGTFDFAPAYVGLNSGPNYAFFGLHGGTGDLIRISLSVGDFAGISHLNNSTFGPAFETINFFGFTNIDTSGGALTFSVESAPGFLTASSTGDVASGVPELSTWAMMLVGFASMGFAAFLRSRSRGEVLKTGVLNATA